MDVFITRYCLSLLLLTSAFGSGTESNETTSQEETRKPRVSGRIVKLYSGVKPEPYYCPAEGFQADPKNCAVFYRCVKERNGKFTVFRYQCAPGTIYDPDVETCNHPRSTRRTECGGTKKTSFDKLYTTQANEVNEVQSELPKPIITKEPIYTDQTTFKHPVTVPWVQSTQAMHTISHSSFIPSERNTFAPTSFSGTTTTSWSSPNQHRVTEYETRPTTQKYVQLNDGNEDFCTADGFMGDSNNCRKFYRCVSNQRGGFVKYEFMCTELTVWDDQIEACNHPWAVNRSKCGRSLSHADYSDIQKTTNNDSMSTSNSIEPNTTKSNRTIQHQLQISHGSEVQQTQTQISHSNEVIQNQTQINYDNQKNENKNLETKQNQTQISHVSAVSQTQTQINYGDKGIQTQLQIDHSRDSSQSQVQIQQSTTSRTSKYTTQNSHTTVDVDYEVDNGYGNQINEETSKTSTTTTVKSDTGSGTVCTTSGFVGNEYDCRIFYRCVDNGNGGFTKFEFKCGDGTLWDPEIDACNHASAVKHCGNYKPSETSNVETTSANIQTTKEPTKTTQNYFTTSNVDDNGDVGYGNHISQETSTSSGVTTHITTIGTANNNENSTECTSSGFIGDAHDCRIFYRCVENGNNGFTKYEFKCGDGTVWDPEIESCNHAWAVEKCGSSRPNNNVDNEIDNTERPQNVATTVTLVQVTTQSPTQNNDYDSGYQTHNDEPDVATITITTVQPEVQTGNDCKSSGFMGDERDCKKFYRCVDNGNGSYTRYEFSCGEGTVWDSEIEACNHVWAVEKCGGNSASEDKGSTSSPTLTTIIHGTSEHTPQNSMSTEPSTYTTTLSTTSSSAADNACTSSGFMGDNKNCKKFYRCVDNGDGSFTRYEFTCGEGTVWDPNIEACNHAWAVEKCGNQSNNNYNEPSTSSSPIMQDESQENGYPTQSHDSSENSPATSSTEVTKDTPNKSNICQTSGFVGDQNDCKKFYRCVDNGNGSYDRYEFSCGEGTVWDSSIEACNHAWAVKNCGASESSTTHKPPQQENTSQSTSSPISEDHTQKSTQGTIATIGPGSEESDDECTQEGFFGSQNDCKRFYRCVSNNNGGFIKYEFTCGEGTVWNQEIQACDHQSAGKTCATNSASQTLTSGSQSETTTHSYDTTAKTTKGEQVTQSETTINECTSEGFYAHESDCKKFVRCVDNGNGGYTKYEFSCGDGTVWVQEIQACDHDNDVTSCKPQSQNSYPVQTDTYGEQSSSSSETSVVSSTETMKPDKEHDEYENEDGEKPSQNKSDECTSEGYFGNKKDCRKFYRCVDNGNGGFTKYDFVCGEGTAWDSNIQSCNHINEVESCSGDISYQENESQTQNENEVTTSKNESDAETTTKANEASSSSTTSSSSSNSSKEDSCESEGYFGSSSDCKKFYRCVDNGKGGYTKYDFTCGEGTIWDQDITTCNHPQDVTNPSCSNSQDTSTSSPDSSSTTSTTSSTSQTSSSSTTSSSSSSEEIDSSEEQSNKPTNQNITCNEAGYYPNPNDCKKFYRCVDWDGDGKKFSVFHFECGEGTIWDPALDTCNHEESVYPPRDCSGSQSQNVSESSTTTDSTTTEQSTSSEQTTTNEPTTTQQSTTSEKTTTQESTTSEPTTAQQSTTSEQTTTQKSTTTTTQKSTTSETTTTQQSTTSEQTTTQQSTTTEQTTTQQSTTSEQTTQASTTSEQTTTQENTENSSTTTEASTESTTTTTEGTTDGTTSSSTQGTTEESSDGTTESTTTTTEESSTETSTTESNSSNKECPETEDDQYLLVCPTSFKRHPKYCNMFYQCTEDEDTNEAKIATFKCPNNTIYDESQTQCVEENKAEKKCDGEMANKRRFKRLGLNYREPITADKSRHSCETTGYFSFENDSECSKGFLKCEKTNKGRLRGYVYQCPDGYIYWSISKRCERLNNIRDCKKSNNDWIGRWNIPVERKNLAL